MDATNTPEPAPAFRPAYQCDSAALTLMWEPSQLGWELREGTRVLGTLPGYPVSAPPNGNREALAWADSVTSGQRWIAKPARSCAFHTHATPDTPCC